MSKRGDIPALKDILEAINRIERYIGTSSLGEFIADTETQDAVVRNFEVIGEAVKNLSADFRKTHTHVEWARIAALRDKLIHHYFSVDWDVLWDVAKNKLPQLREQVRGILAGGAGEPG